MRSEDFPRIFDTFSSTKWHALSVAIVVLTVLVVACSVVYACFKKAGFKKTDAENKTCSLEMIYPKVVKGI